MNIPTMEEFAQDLAGGQPVTLSGGTSPTSVPPGQTPVDQGAAAQQAASGAPAAPQRAPIPGGNQQNNADIYGAGGSTQERLLSPLAGRTQQTGSDIGALGETFRSAAGPTGQTFQSRGGQQALEGYIGASGEGEAQRQAATERARQFTQAAYKGPEQLDAEGTARARQKAQDLATQARGLRSGYGVQSILSQAAPGLTRGQLKYEARNTLADEDYRRRAAQASEAASNLLGQLSGEEQAAQALAAQRAQEEAAIQAAARDYLGTNKGTITGELEARVSDKNAQRKALSDAYQKFLASGDTNDLSGIEGVSADIDKLNTPGRALQGEAKAAYDAILNDPRFGAVKAFDPLDLMISKRGREKYTATLPEFDLSGDTASYLDPNAGDGGKKPKQKAPKDLYHQKKAGLITQDQRLLLEERQKALEAAGFAPRTTKVKQAGKYSLVNPLYLDDQGVQLNDIQNYTTLDPGVLATRENQATAGEAERFNRIQDLLEGQDRINAAELPFRRAGVTADIPGILGDEQAAFEAERAQQAGASKKFRKSVSRARDAYKNAQAISNFGGKIVKGVTGSESLANQLGGIGANLGRGDFGGAASQGVNFLNPMFWAGVGMEGAQHGADQAQAAGRKAADPGGIAEQAGRELSSAATKSPKRARKKVRM